MHIFSIGKLSDGTNAAKCTFSVSVNTLMVPMQQNAYSLSVKLSDGTNAAKCT